MSFLDKIFGSKKPAVTLEQLKNEPYEQKYLDECKYIWKNYVPKSGQSEVLQGELLRALEKLRYEACNNGNCNWDGDFKYFCGFIKDNLTVRDIYSEEEKAKIILITDYFRECGEYSGKVYDENVSDEEFEDDFDVSRIAYTEDNLYDFIADMIGKLWNNDPQPIPYEKNDNIKR